MEDNYNKIRKLIIAINKIDGAYYFVAKKMGIKENTLALLSALEDGKGHTQREISADWLIPKTTVNTIVKEMEALGYLEIICCEHKKEKTIRLTKKGIDYTNKVFENIYKAERAAFEKTFNRYGDDFVEVFNFFSDSLCEEFEKY